MWFQQHLVLLACLLATALAAQPTDEELGICCLCDGCDFVANGRDDFLVDESGTTCYDILLDMADDTTESKPGNGACQSLKAQYRQTCCDSNYDPPEVAQAPTPAPVSNLPQGKEPVCNVCPDGGKPGLPKTVAAVLYIPGVNTCERLYEMGLKGLILDRLCNPIQDYLFVDCGCGIGEGREVAAQQAPRVQDLSTSTPTLSPTVATAIDPAANVGEEDKTVISSVVEDPFANSGPTMTAGTTDTSSAAAQTDNTLTNSAAITQVSMNSLLASASQAVPTTTDPLASSSFDFSSTFASTGGFSTGGMLTPTVDFSSFSSGGDEQAVMLLSSSKVVDPLANALAREGSKP